MLLVFGMLLENQMFIVGIVDHSYGPNMLTSGRGILLDVQTYCIGGVSTLLPNTS